MRPKKTMALSKIVRKATSPGVFTKALQIVKFEGLGSLVKKVRSKISGNQQFFNALQQAETFGSVDVSIIIPVYNASRYTQECIESVYSVENQVKFELIVVDNNSNDDTEKLISPEVDRRHNFSYHRLEKNLGFSGGVNEGIKRAKGKYILLLNNDTRVTDHWLDNLVALAEDHPELGIISPVTNNIGEGNQLDLEAKELKIEKINEYAAKIQDRAFDTEPIRLVFFCVLIRKSLINLIGLLDEGYSKGNFEDDDFCLRARLCGYKLGIAKNSFIYHHGSITFKENKISHSAHIEENRRRYFSKAQDLAVASREPSPMPKESEISFIVRTMDRPKLLTRALRSLSNQVCKNFTVIVVNDGEKDVSPIVECFREHYPIKYFNPQEKLGRTKAINVGISSVETEWIAFLDDDDLLYPWHTAVLTDAKQRNPQERIFYCDYNKGFFKQSTDETPFLTKLVDPWEYSKNEMWVRNHLPIHTWLIRKSCVDQIGLFDENLEMLEDFEFLVRLTTCSDFFHVRNASCEYRFYLEGLNSMLFQREKIKEAIKYIYQVHTSDLPEILTKRNAELKAIESEIEKIRTLRLQDSEMSELTDKTKMEIASLILGFD